MPEIGAEQNGSPPFPLGGGLLGIPAKAVKTAVGRLPDIPRNKFDFQPALEEFRQRFAMASNILELDGANLNRRTARVARMMVESCMMDEETVVELRMIMPESSLTGDMVSRGLERIAKLRHVLADEHDVTRTVPNSHPIMPTKRVDSAVDPAGVWGPIGHELDGFRHQWRLGSDRPNLAVMAILPSDYMEHIFGSGTGIRPQDHMKNIVILDGIGTNPQDNTLSVPRY